MHMLDTHAPSRCEKQWHAMQTHSTHLDRSQDVDDGIVAVRDVQLASRDVILTTHHRALVHPTDTCLLNLKIIAVNQRELSLPACQIMNQPCSFDP